MYAHINGYLASSLPNNLVRSGQEAPDCRGPGMGASGFYGSRHRDRQLDPQGQKTAQWYIRAALGSTASHGSETRPRKGRKGHNMATRRVARVRVRVARVRVARRVTVSRRQVVRTRR